MKKWLLLVVGLFVLARMLFDSSANPAATVWLEAEQRNRMLPSESYFHLLGMDAVADPVTVGRQRLQAYEEQIAEGRSDIVPFDYPLLEMPSDRQLCKPGEYECLSRLRNDSTTVGLLLDEHRVLLKRYLTWLNGEPARTLATPSGYEPVGAYLALAKGHRLRALQALDAIQQNEGLRALSMRQQDIRQLRRHLQQADDLMTKMIVASLLADDLNQVARYRAQGMLSSPAPQPELSAEERGLALPIRREFATSVHAIRTLVPRESSLTYRFVMRVGIKQNRTINEMFRYLDDMARFGALESSNLVSEISSSEAAIRRSPWREPSNAAGRWLLNQSRDMRTYSLRLHDLDAKIRLFNLLSQLPNNASIDPTELATRSGADNPYYPGRQARWDATAGALCFEGPRTDQHGFRCLPLR